MRYKIGGCSKYTKKPCSTIAIMHLSGMQSGVSQTVRKGSWRGLHQTRLGALNKKVDSQASNHASGIESSQQSHCADIPSITGPVSRARLIRLASVGSSRSRRA